jgi:hypothetical protein
MKSPGGCGVGVAPLAERVPSASQSEVSDPSAPHDARRRYYHLTPLGAQAVREEAELLARLVDAAHTEMPVAGMFWGERYGIVRDPFGHHWSLCTRREQLAPDEVADRVPSEPTDRKWAGH